MPAINSSLVPLVQPGNLFNQLTGNTTLNVRWYTPTDPVFYEVLNRPISDVVLRQLILAKTLDQLSISIGHEAIFPFLIPALLVGSPPVEIPAGWIWDLHFSAPVEWTNFRLSQIRRISGTTVCTSDCTSGSGNSPAMYSTGLLRLVFTANNNSTVETAIFTADYQIDSTLNYQRAPITIANSTTGIATYISPGDALTVAGFATFRTLAQTEPTVQAFLNAVLPPSSGTVGANGLFPTSEQTIYPLVDAPSPSSGSGLDYSLTGMAHGTGLLVDSCYCPMPQLDSSVQGWIETFNYPFDAVATRIAIDASGIQIPLGLFREFSLAVPAGDQPTGDSSGTYYPVWISRIEPTSVGIRFFFATYNVTDTSPSLDPIEFATLDLRSTFTAGQLVAIIPSNNLELQSTTESDIYGQHFGRGHVVLSDVWSGDPTVITAFFNAFGVLEGQYVTFSQATTRLSSFGLNRVPKYIPTIGQSQAMAGTSSTLTIPVPPSADNLFVTEQDQGLGNTVDFAAAQNSVILAAAAGVARYGYTGALCHRIVQLCVDYTQIPTGSSAGAGTYYDTYILPRLTILLGRAPQFGDQWFNGTNLLFFNGDSWQSP